MGAKSTRIPPSEAKVITSHFNTIFELSNEMISDNFKLEGDESSMISVQARYSPIEKVGSEGPIHIT